MFKNYLVTAVRNLLREKGTTLINLSGLTIGISCSIILFLLISFHKSFDTFHEKRDRIIRIVNSSEGNQGREYQSGIPSVLPDAFRLDFPEAEEVIFTSYRSDALILVPQSSGVSKKFQEEHGVVFTEPGYFKIFDRKVLQGEGAAGIDQPNEAVLSKSLAEKYFGHSDVVGELLKFENHDYRVAGIIEDAPRNTDLPFNLLLSYSTIEKATEEHGWGSIWSDEQCYALIKEGSTVDDIQARLAVFTKKHDPEHETRKTQFIAQPLPDLHFDSRFDTYNYTTIPETMLTAFGVISAILLLTACINFINLSTAEAIKRSKEVGIRKTLGSTKTQLIFQFLGETTLLTSVAVLLSIGLTQVALGILNPFLSLDLSIDLSNNGPLILYLIFVTVGVSLFSGLYPAFVVSGYRPALALKNKIGNRNSSGYMLRSSLVVVQFFISQFFIIGTIVLIEQMKYFQQKDLGFSKDAILIVPMPEDVSRNGEVTLSKRKSLRDEMARVPGVEIASLASTPPSSGSVSKTGFTIEGDANEYLTQVKQVDGQYLDIYALRMVAGGKLHDLDSTNGYVVNETFAKTLGFQDPNEIVGKSITIWGRQYPVFGVVQDFHTVSLEQGIEPTALFTSGRGFRTLALKVNLSKVEDVTRVLKEKWEAAYPEELFEYEFLDDSIREFYDGERRMATLLTGFTSLAIFIGCLGLFGLATFMANQKRKEIGVRKVLGASAESIVFLFSREYAKLILIGFLLAAPLAGFAMQQFLNEFAYKIELGVGIFVMSLAITALVALVTVGYRSFRAAVVNPVNSLRYE
jgi:putative ABC transport system permease protein